MKKTLFCAFNSIVFVNYNKRMNTCSMADFVSEKVEIVFIDFNIFTEFDFGFALAGF